MILAITAAMFVAPAVLQARCGAREVVEATELRAACVEMCTRARAGQGMPGSIAELVYDGVFGRLLIDSPCSATDYSRVMIGRYSFRDVVRHRMSRSDLLAEIARARPNGGAWDVLGPMVLCMDARAYETGDAKRIVGWIVGGSGSRRWNHIAAADEHVSTGYWLGKPWLEESVDESATWYASAGIPMPVERMRELRESVSIPGRVE